MSQASSSLGVAVIGAGMAGRAHIAGYRSAGTLYASNLPEVRLVAVGDLNQDFASAAARRFGYERAQADWKRIAHPPHIDLGSLGVANHPHPGVVEGLLARGQHGGGGKRGAPAPGGCPAAAVPSPTSASSFGGRSLGCGGGGCRPTTPGGGCPPGPRAGPPPQGCPRPASRWRTRIWSRSPRRSPPA